MNKEDFINKLKEAGLLLNEKQIKQLDEYAYFLKEYNEKINLTAITDYEEVLDKHFYDSLIGFLNLKMEGSLVDIGTGAGFPGVVLKICYPNLKVTLIEPIKKRCLFLEELINKLDLKDIIVVNQRSEDYVINNREVFDYGTARAVSHLNILIEVCGALVKKDGYFVALKGSSGRQEIIESKNAIKKMGFEVDKINDLNLFDGSKRTIIYLKKKELTPKKFPRKYSIINKKPL